MRRLKQKDGYPDTEAVVWNFAWVKNMIIGLRANFRTDEKNLRQIARILFQTLYRAPCVFFYYQAIRGVTFRIIPGKPFSVASAKMRIAQIFNHASRNQVWNRQRNIVSVKTDVMGVVTKWEHATVKLWRFTSQYTLIENRGIWKKYRSSKSA